MRPEPSRRAVATRIVHALAAVALIVSLLAGTGEASAQQAVETPQPAGCELTDAERARLNPVELEIWPRACETGIIDPRIDPADTRSCLEGVLDTPMFAAPGDAPTRQLSGAIVELVVDRVAASRVGYKFVVVNCASVSWVSIRRNDPQLALTFSSSRLMGLTIENSVLGSLWIGDTVFFGISINGSTIKNVTLMDAALRYGDPVVRKKAWPNLDATKDINRGYGPADAVDAIDIVNSEIQSSLVFAAARPTQMAITRSQLGMISLDGSSLVSLEAVETLVERSLTFQDARLDHLSFNGEAEVVNGCRAAVTGNVTLATIRSDGSVNFCSGNEIHVFNGSPTMLETIRPTRIGGTLELQYSSLATLQAENLDAGSVYLTYAKVDGNVRLGGMRLAGDLHAYGVAVKGEFDASRSTIGGLTTLNQGSFDRAFLNDSQYGGKFEAFSVEFGRSLDCADCTFGSDLILRNAAAESFHISGSIAGRLSGGGITTGDITFTNLTVGGDLDVSGLSARNGYLYRSKVAGDVHFHSANVTGYLSLGGSVLSSDVYLTDARIASLLVAGATFSKRLYLTGATIDGTLTLSNIEPVDGDKPARSANPEWGGESTLVLAGAKIRIIQADEAAFDCGECASRIVPVNIDGLDLASFQAPYLPGVASNGFLSSRPDRLVAFLDAGMSGFRPQPFQLLGDLLRRAGYNDAADAVMIEKAKRSIAERPALTSWFLNAFGWTIGYGYAIERAVWLLFALVLAGSLVFVAARYGERRRTPNYRDALFYSIDRTIPGLSLSHRYQNLSLAPFPVEAWFFLQRISGFFLLSALIGGIAGLFD